MLRLAICDDSCEGIEQLERVLEALSFSMNEYDVFLNGMELLKHLKVCNPKYDLYILDLEMHKTDGMAVARSIRKMDSKVLIVFLANHLERIQEVFQVWAFDFLIKPITLERMRMVLTKANEYCQIMVPKFNFSFDRDYYVLDCSDIIYFEKEKRKVHIHAKSRQYVTYCTMHHIAEQLDASVFAPIACSYIINLAFLKELHSHEVVLENHIHLPVQRGNKNYVKEKLQEFLRQHAT
ncbi:MAG: LytTR family DNA-binding domain-containing protein [Lachnospiraceae bacterium]